MLNGPSWFRGYQRTGAAAATKQKARLAAGFSISIQGRSLRFRTVVTGALDIGDLALGRLLPDVHDVVQIGAVALLVIGDVAEHGVEGHAGMHLLGDLLRIGEFSPFCRLLDDLDPGIAVGRISLRLELLRAELAH